MPRTTQSWWDAVGSEFCRRAFAHALDAVIASDEGGRILEFNPAAEQMFSMERSEVLGRELSETILPYQHRRNHREALRRRATRHPASPLARRMETTARRHGGTEFPVELSLTSLQVDPPIFIAFLRDLSTRKEAESALERYRLMVEATEDIMALLGPDHLVVASNPATDRAFAKPPGGSVDQRTVDLLGAEMFARIAPYVERAWQGESVAFQAWMELPGPGRRYLANRYSPVRDAEGRVVGVVADLRDLSDLQ